MNKRTALFPALKLIIIISLGTGVIFFSRDISAGIRNGMYLCAEALLPSLFPFMVLSSAVSKTLRINGKIINKFSNKLFGLSPSGLFAVIMGAFGGYPVGAVSIKSLYKRGAVSKQEAKKAAYTAFGAGPAFLITFVGIKLLNSAEIGIILLTSQIISVIIIGVIVNHIIKVDNSNKEFKSVPYKGDIFVSSVSDAVHSVIEMCAMICVFSGILKIAENFFGIYADILLEVTSASNKLCSERSFILLAFAIGFGGLCVHFQVFGLLKEIEIKKAIFFFIRIIQGALTSFFTFIQFKIFNVTVPVFSSTSSRLTPVLSGSVIGSVLLVLTGISFLYSLNRRSICAE